MSPQAYKIEVRMQKAEYMLENTPMSVEQIGELLGYKEIASFSRQFKKMRGISPVAYRKRLNGKEERA